MVAMQLEVRGGIGRATPNRCCGRAAMMPKLAASARIEHKCPVFRCNRRTFAVHRSGRAVDVTRLRWLTARSGNFPSIIHAGVFASTAARLLLAPVVTSFTMVCWTLSTLVCYNASANIVAIRCDVATLRGGRSEPVGTLRRCRPREPLEPSLLFIPPKVQLTCFFEY
jgi:hypothetical protein